SSSTPSSPTNHSNLPNPAARKLGITLTAGLNSQRSVLELAQTSEKPGIDAPSRSGRRSQPPVPHPRRGQPIKPSTAATRRPPPPPIPTATTNSRNLLPPIPPPSAGTRTPSRPQTPTSPLSQTMSRMAIEEPDHTAVANAVPVNVDLAPSPQLSSASLQSALGISNMKSPVVLRAKTRRPPPPPPRKGRKGVGN